MLLCARRQIFTLGRVPKGAEVKTWGQTITNRAAGEKSPLRELVWVGVQTRADSASTLRCGTGGQHCPSVYPSAGQSQVDRRKALSLPAALDRPASWSHDAQGGRGQAPRGDPQLAR